MLATIPYRRENAVAYARRWALSRNPLFENYAGIGGDCTNFVSQAIYAGGCVMNYTPTFGWYYISPTDRAPAWTGVEFFYNFMTSNEEIGPYATEVREGDLLPGDVIQFRDGVLYLNNAPLREPYVRYVSDWNTKPVKISPGHCYVVGDNRSQYIENHRFGQIRAGRIMGAPLF